MADIDVQGAAGANAENATVDFKSRFDTSKRWTWPETIKDIVAMANSGGGVIVFGVNDDGTPCGDDLTQLATTDPAVFVDKLASYVGEQWDGVAMHEAHRGGQRVLCLEIQAAESPFVFQRDGDWGDPKKPQFAFRRGAVYFRHGAKSEPADSHDLHRLIRARVDTAVERFQANLAIIQQDPLAALTHAPEVGGVVSDQDGLAVRFTNDPDALAVVAADPNATHPYKCVEVVQEVKKRSGVSKFTTYDVSAIRYAHGIENRPEFYFAPRTGSAQYSEGFVDWVLDHLKEPSFRRDARRDYRFR